MASNITEVRVRFLVKPEFFHIILFQLLTFIEMRESFPLSILVTLYNNGEHFLSQILGCQGKTN